MSTPFDYYFPKLDFGISTKKLTDYILCSPERKHFEDLKYFEVEVSDDFAGFFIGKNGKNIKNLRDKYPTSKILISKENGKRYIYISNSQDKFKVIGYLMKGKNA